MVLVMAGLSSESSPVSNFHLRLAATLLDSGNSAVSLLSGSVVELSIPAMLSFWRGDGAGGAARDTAGRESGNFLRKAEEFPKFSGPCPRKVDGSAGGRGGGRGGSR